MTTKKADLHGGNTMNNAGRVGGRTFLVFLFCVAFTIFLPAQTLTTLTSFDGANGAYPEWMSLVQGTDGHLYGVTEYGGANNSCLFGCGTVFKVTPSGTLATLHSFGGSDGSNPQGGLVQSTDGNLYGTTFQGGTSTSCALGCGTIFKITPSGTLMTLHSFCSDTNCVDGTLPYAGLVQGTDGSFYGTTQAGGTSGFGTVFKITAGGTLTTLHSFDFTDGSYPFTGLIQAADGSFYGTTFQGGANSCFAAGTNVGCGTVFKITSAGQLTTVYNFCAETNCIDGWAPYGALVQATDGKFYGTTYEGGTGTVFKMTSTGTLTTLYSFTAADGAPEAGLAQGTDGSFYGTSCCGGSNGDGIVFKISSAGTFTTLYNFDSTHGAFPYSTLVQATDGKFYGTTGEGGSDGEGTVFSLGVGLKPFVEMQPTSGPVGLAVRILGNNLTGATSVTFNGVPAKFTIVSPSFITTTVPDGATTGSIQVTTPSGTLKSNVPFRIRS